MKIEFTAQETKMLKLLALGVSNRAIAKHLGLTYGTARVYLCKLYAKLRVTGRTQAALWYIKRQKQSARIRRRSPSGQGIR